MKPLYIWQYPDWPAFSWNTDAILNLLTEVRMLEGRISGMMEGLGFEIQSKTSLDVMTEDIIPRNKQIEIMKFFLETSIPRILKSNIKSI